jgi:hypothetical protein
MFNQLVTTDPPNPAQVVNNINSLFTYSPLQISAIVETVWLNRNNAASLQTSSPFLSWSPQITHSILSDTFFSGYDYTASPPTQLPPVIGTASFVPPLQQPGIAHTWNPGLGGGKPTTAQATNWHHLIYAYVLENTGIFRIFTKVLETYMVGEQLEVPSPASQLFWRNLEFLVFGDAMPSMVWTTSSRTRRDELANRLTAYYWMFGLDLSHAAELVGEHPYEKPAAANRDFIRTFEDFGREVWRGITNAKNISGVNDTDPTVIATLARRLYDMTVTRRTWGNGSREEFRAVAIMSFLHLAVLYDSPPVVDLKATASSPEMRLQKIAERVGLTAHSKSKPLFDLCGPFSVLMQSIESSAFNEPSGAQLLYAQSPPTAVSRNAEKVIDQYSLATGCDLKSRSVSIVPRAKTSPLPAPQRQTSSSQLAGRRANGQMASKQ